MSNEEKKQCNCESPVIEPKTKECHCTEYLDMAKRVQAEFDNYRKRTNNAVEEARLHGQGFAIIVIMPVLESIEEALKLNKDDVGLNLIKKQFENSLSSLGVKEIEALGKDFNPNTMNAALAEQIKDTPPNRVLQVWQKGYTINGKVLRPATVKISK